MSMDSPISPKCEIGSRQLPDVVPAPEVDRAPRQFTEDPYTFVEGITVVQSLAHTGRLTEVFVRLQAFEAMHGLGFLTSSDLLVYAIPVELLEGTGYHIDEEGGRLAFDIALWPVAADTDPHAKSIRWGAWGVPLLCMEFVLDSSRSADLTEKRQVCQRMWVGEYWVFDWHDPQTPLQGWRLDRWGTYQPIKPDASGELWSNVLHTSLRVTNGMLEWWDPQLRHWYTVEHQNWAKGFGDGRLQSFLEFTEEYLITDGQAQLVAWCQQNSQHMAMHQLPKLGTIARKLETMHGPEWATYLFSLVKATPEREENNGDQDTNQQKP